MDISTTPLPPDVNIGIGLVIAAWIWGVLGSSLLAMRMYVRIFVVKKIGWDDWTMVITVILALVTGVLITLMVHYGVGRHTFYLQDEQRVNAVYMIWLTVPVSPSSAAIGKVSIALLLRRLMGRSCTGWKGSFLSALIFFLLAVNLVMIIITFAQCKPVTFLWNRVGSGSHGTCWSPKIQQYYGYFQGAFSAWSDLVLALFPITIIWNLQIPLKSKLAVSALMSLGSIATAAAVIKTIQLRNLATPDFTWDAVSLVYWFIAENWIIIIGACVPTIKPLFTNNWGIFTRLASLVSGKSFASTAATHDESSNHCNNNDLESQNSYGLESRRLLYEQARPQVGGSGDMPMRPLPPLPSHDPGKN